MSIYDDMRKVAAQVMPEFKQGDIRYVSTTRDPSARPDRPGAATDTPSEPLNATASPVSTKYLAGTSIVETDIQVTIPNDGKATPDMNGKMRIDGTDYQIIAVMSRPAAGDPISWTVVVRR